MRRWTEYARRCKHVARRVQSAQARSAVVMLDGCTLALCLLYCAGVFHNIQVLPR
jgi:hypothetical protein